MPAAKVLVLCDRPGWAFQHIGQVLQAALPEFDITVTHELRPCKVDLLVSLYWPLHLPARGIIQAGRAAVLCYDHFSWGNPLARHNLLLSVRRADAFGVANRRLLAELGPLAAEAERPIQLVEDGVDTQLFQPAPLPAAFSAMWCGNSEAGAPGLDIKGLLLLQQACLRAEVPLRVLDSAQHKALPHAEMPAFYQQGSVYLCGSLAEGTPNPVLEALACGRPVLSTDVGLVQEAVTPACGAIVPRTVEAFAQALADLREKDLAPMAAAARAAALPHDWSNKIAAWRTLLETALGAPERLRPPPKPQLPGQPLPRMRAPWLGPGPLPEREAPRGPLRLVSERARDEERAPIMSTRPRPRIAILSDVPTWAWARKAAALKAQLSDRFDIAVWQSSDERTGPALAKKDYDLLHTFEVGQAAVLPDGLPLVTGITAHVWRTWEDRHGAGIMRRWADRALAFHANSQLLLREMEELLGRFIYYVPNGVDEAFFCRSRPRTSGHLVVGFVAKDNVRKGYPIVAEACRRAGVELREVRRRSGDALPAEEMRAFYQDLHVLAVSSDMDGTPNPALEAAACECAIVSNRIGNMPEFIRDGENGFLTERSVESLADHLGHLASLPLEEVEAMGRAARATVEAGWTWAQQAPRYAKMWEACLAGRQLLEARGA